MKVERINNHTVRIVITTPKHSKRYIVRRDNLQLLERIIRQHTEQFIEWLRSIDQALAEQFSNIIAFFKRKQPVTV